MPPRHSFWVILIGKTPTSFRGKMREDLVPTLRQLQRTQSDVTLRWFERGKVWESPEAAIGAAKLAATAAREKRTKEWRPGGEHRDPKARFELTRDQKRAKFKREQGGKDDGPPRDDRGHDRPQSPFGPRPPRGPRPDRPWSDRSKPGSFPERARPDHVRPDRARPERPLPDRARSDRPWSDRPKFDRPKPGGSPFGERAPRPPRGERRDNGDRGERRDRPWGPSGQNPFKDRHRSDRPGARDDRPDRRPDRPDRRDRPRRPDESDRPNRSERPPDIRPASRPGRPSSGRPVKPGRPGGNRGGFKPPKRRS